jgi:hypothetical protein
MIDNITAAKTYRKTTLYAQSCLTGQQIFFVGGVIVSTLSASRGLRLRVFLSVLLVTSTALFLSAVRVHGNAKPIYIRLLVHDTIARGAPDLLAKKGSMLGNNTTYQLVGRTNNGEWLEIILPMGNHGWVMANLVQFANLSEPDLQSALNAVPVTAKETPFLDGALSNKHSTGPLLITSGSAVFSYVAPDRFAPQIARLADRSSIKATARSANQEWVMTEFGWLSIADTQPNGDVSNLPVLGLLFPSDKVSAILASHKAIYKRSVAKGRRLDSVTMLSDSTLGSRPFDPTRLAEGRFDYRQSRRGLATLLRFPKLQNRPFIAAQSGFTTGAVLNPQFANPKLCLADESPLACDLRITQASVVFVALGTNDQYTWQQFEGNYRHILEYCLSQGALPVLLTKADDNESGSAGSGAFNNLIRRLGQEYKLPVIDMWEATRALPEQGTIEDRFHLNDYGLDLRLLLILQVLDSLA